MHLPLLPPFSNSQVYVQGDVSIDESAAIAPGVIIQADPDCKIIIAAGVCIGMGTIIHAHKGNLEVEAGVILGAGVLLVGTGKIGANACIGAATTVFNASVESCQVVPPGSLLGAKGRQIADTPQARTTEDAANQPESENFPPESLNGQGIASAPAPSGEDTPDESAIATTPPTPSGEDTPEEPGPKPPPVGIPVYGQANLNRLLLTLFPHHKSANPPPEDNHSE
ncbi:transferase [Cyanobacteria bacterium FACHB-472]|nr:transferase [Cyanobacteria bacterium FACHB-472]